MVGALSHRIRALVRTDRQKHNSFVQQARAKTILTFGYATTLFANDKDDPKVAINANAATAAQIQVPASIIEVLCVVIWILEDPLDFAINPHANVCIAPIVLAEKRMVLVGV